MSVSRILPGILVVMALAMSACSTEGRSYSGNSSYAGPYSTDSYTTGSYSLPEVNSGNGSGGDS